MRYILFLPLLLASCGFGQKSPPFCQGASAESYAPGFKVSCPAQMANYILPLRFACKPGQGISPPIKIEGMPAGTTHLHIVLQDTTCTYDCTRCCQFNHWVIDIPIEKLENGLIPEGSGARSDYKSFFGNNSFHQKEYFPLCPPKDQMHAWVFKVKAYSMNKGKQKILGRSMSVPMLFTFEGAK